jgi:prevent-host-death family protein
MSVTVNVQEAEAQFARLLEQAHAGQEIIVAKAGRPYARLMPPAPEVPQRRPGRLKGQVSDEFFEPLPEDVLNDWEQNGT